MKRILVLTDNTHIYKMARPILEGVSDRAHLVWACSPGTSFFEDEGFVTVSVKEDPEKLAADYDLILSLHCKQIFPETLVSKTCCVNLHPGYNPYNKGWYPHVFSMVNGKPAGATLHVMAAAVDAGPIIDRLQIAVEPTDTSLEVYEKVLKAEIGLLEKHLQALLEGSFHAELPAEEGGYNSKKDYADLCRFDLAEPGTFGSFLDRLRALSHGEFRNAHYVDENGDKVFMRIHLEKE